MRTDDGAFVVGEPQGSPTWFPCNDHPTDKATYRDLDHGPAGDAGDLERHAARAHAEQAQARTAPPPRHARHKVADRVTWDYGSPQPMATYLATATVGDFTIDRRRVAGLGSLVAVDPTEARAARAKPDARPDRPHHHPLRRPLRPVSVQPDRRDRRPRADGRLRAGDPDAPDLRPGARRDHPLPRDRSPVVRRLGQPRSAGRTCGSTRGSRPGPSGAGSQAQGGRTTAQQLAGLELQPASRTDLWDPPANAIPDASQLFATSVYTRGAMALEALRQRVGDATFYDILRTWAAEHAYLNANTAEFIDLAEAEVGRAARRPLHQVPVQAGQALGHAPRARRKPGPAPLQEVA